MDIFVEPSSSDEYEADEEDTHEVGYVSEPSASILSVNINTFLLFAFI